MGAFTATAADYLIDWMTGKTTPPAVATRYITTYNGDPQGAGSENIATLTGSANRIAITASMDAAAASSAASNANIVFTSSASGGVTVDHVAIFSAITAGTLYASAAVTSKTVAAGDGLQILSGNLVFSIS